jgi:hypothetical protein
MYLVLTSRLSNEYIKDQCHFAKRLQPPPPLSAFGKATQYSDPTVKFYLKNVPFTPVCPLGWSPRDTLMFARRVRNVYVKCGHGITLVRLFGSFIPLLSAHSRLSLSLSSLTSKYTLFLRLR